MARLLTAAMIFVLGANSFLVAEEPALPRLTVALVAQAGPGNLPLPDGLVARSDKDGKMEVQLVDLAAMFGMEDDKLEDDIRDLKVTLVGMDGLSQEAASDERGIATFENQIDGWFSLVVASADKEKHGALPIYVKSTQEVAPAPLVFPVASIREEDVLKNLRGYVGDDQSPLVSLAGSDAYENRNVFFYRVHLQSDGSLPGRVIVPMQGDLSGWGDLSQMNVTILKSGREIARAVTDREGRFSISEMEPGIYGVIAAGRLGYSAFAFEVLPPAEPVLVQPVAFRANEPSVSNELIILLIPPPLIPDTERAIDRSYATSGGASAGTSGSPGSGSGSSAGSASGSPASSGTATTGGGGGGGGGGGIGALGALGGIAAGLAGSGSSNNNVASPAVP